MRERKRKIDIARFVIKLYGKRREREKRRKEQRF